MPKESKPDSMFFAAPLVDIVDTNVSALNEDQLRNYLTRVREMRASKQTMKAKTSQTTTKKSIVNLNDLM